MRPTDSKTPVCAGAPPGMVTKWRLLTKDAREVFGQGQTAFVACASVGLSLSDVESLTPLLDEVVPAISSRSTKQENSSLANVKVAIEAMLSELNPSCDAAYDLRRILQVITPVSLEDRLARGNAALAKQLVGIEEGPTVDDMTCAKCEDEPGCPDAWDLYNTHGDCLAEK